MDQPATLYRPSYLTPARGRQKLCSVWLRNTRTAPRPSLVAEVMRYLPLLCKPVRHKIRSGVGLEISSSSVNRMAYALLPSQVILPALSIESMIPSRSANAELIHQLVNVSNHGVRRLYRLNTYSPGLNPRSPWTLARTGLILTPCFNHGMSRLSARRSGCARIPSSRPPGPSSSVPISVKLPNFAS